MIIWVVKVTETEECKKMDIAIKELIFRMKHGFKPECPYNRYLDEEQKGYMEELGKKGLKPCLKENCQYFKKKTFRISAGGNRIGLHVYTREYCSRDGYEPNW